MESQATENLAKLWLNAQNLQLNYNRRI